MKKLLIFIVVFCGINIYSFSQLNELQKFKNEKDLKIGLGMSTSEVRNKLGSPKFVNSGFPASDEILIKEFPELRGQLNNSTWTYFFDPIILKIERPKGYYINDQKVSENVFNEYLDKDYVYMAYGSILDMEGVHAYQITKNNNLKKIEKNYNTTKIESGGIREIKAIPIYCVIYDKGTQSVATTRAYFLTN